METHTHCSLGTMGDFRRICHGITIINLLPVCWWDSQLLLGNDLPAVDSEPFHRHQPRAPCSFPDMTPTSISALQDLSRSIQHLRAIWELTEAEHSCLSWPLPKIIFQTSCYHVCAGTRSHCALAAVADVSVTHNIPTAVGAPSDCTRQLQCLYRALLGCPGILLIFFSDPTLLFPAAFFIFQWSSLLQHS